MKKVLIVYNKIWPYREIIFNDINKQYDLTVAFSDEEFCGRNYSFKTLYLPVKKIGPFDVHKDKLSEIARSYDVVIGLANIRWISLMLLSLRSRRSYKLGFWGIGVTASYENSYDSNELMNKIRYYFAKKSDFTVFYSDYPVQKYLNAGIDKSKLYVANNTVGVKDSKDSSELNKQNFLFLGTLYMQKGLDTLLQSYMELLKIRVDVPNLLIVGDGPERAAIEKFVNIHGMSDKVIFLGKIYDDAELEKIFNITTACISPNQAGLSVLKSMGNGTIFITKKSAITGGEIFNIENKVNGLLYEKDEDLIDILIWLLDNPQKNMVMNTNAYKFYHEYRTPKMMSNSICQAIENSLKS